MEIAPIELCRPTRNKAFLQLETDEENEQESRDESDTNSTQNRDCDISQIMDITRFSTYTKLLRTTTYVLRFVAIMKGRQENHLSTGPRNRKCRNYMG
jgi:hypothetical protein